MPILRCAMALLLATLLTQPFAAGAEPQGLGAPLSSPSLVDPICQTYVFGSDIEERTIGQDGVWWEGQVSEALQVDAIDMSLVLAAEPPGEVRITLVHNGATWAQWDQVVTQAHYAAYARNLYRAASLAPGDALRLELLPIGPPTLRLRVSGPNVVQLCQGGVEPTEPLYLPLVARAG